MEGIKDRGEIQKEIVGSLPSPCHGLLLLSPRVGKTKIGIDIIKREKPKKVLWVTPNTELRDEDIPKEFVTWRAKGYLKRTDIICYASMEKHRGTYDIVILDEYQDVTKSNIKPFFRGGIKYKSIIGLSGTHPKHKEKLDIFTALNLRILVSMDIDEAVENKLIAPYKITVINCRLDSTDLYIEAGSKTKRFKTTERQQYDYLTRVINSRKYSNRSVPAFYYINRMRFIYNLKSKFEFTKKLLGQLKGRTLVFAGSIKQAEGLSKHTYHSKTDSKDLEAFKEGKINTLSLVNAGGVGHTFKNVDNLIISQVNSNQKGDSTQKIARSLVLQEGYVANIFIIVAINTVDETWKDKVLEDFNKDCVTHLSYKNYE